MDFIAFQLQGRFGHFLKAEAGASALSYPAPPRTVIIGLLGAVLGMPKDSPQVELEPASIAVSGELPTTFWHRIKLRKEEPEYLLRTIKKSQKASAKGKDSKATLILQEWLFNPRYTVWAALPEPWHTQLAQRLEHKKWYFQPCLGLSEMSADLVFKGRGEAVPLPDAVHRINTVLPQNCGDLDTDTMFADQLAVNMMRMPRRVTPERVFSHANYLMECNARPVPVKTAQALQWRDKVIVCL
jgi:CRISPR-associated protein Cas5h